MDVFESQFYSVMNKLSNLILLNLLWVVMCLPIITIFSSTSAMYSVFHHWSTKNDNEVVKPFFAHFRKTFKQNMLMSLMAGGVYFLIHLYLLQSYQMPPVILMFFWIAFGFVLLFSVVLIVYYFPMIVLFPKTRTKELVVNSIILAINQLQVTLLAGIGIIIGGFIIVSFPISSLLFISVIAYYVYFCSEKAFQKVKIN